MVMVITFLFFGFLPHTLTMNPQIKQNPWKTKGFNGANRETRTPDPLITNQ